MESDIASTGQLYSLLGWVDKNRKQIISAVVIVVVVGVLVAFFNWRNDQRQILAGEAVSGVMAEATADHINSDALLKVAADYSGTDAAARALQAAAGQLFVDGKLAEAQAVFERFVAEYGQHALLAQAKFGIAMCLDAQGKSFEATTAFKEVVDRFPGANTATPAKFHLAGLYEAQGKMLMARDLYMELTRDGQSSYGSQAISRLTEMIQKDPSLRPGANSAPAATSDVSAPQS